MTHTLFFLFIAPIEFLMRLTLEWGYLWTHSWGWSLVLLSLAVNTAILPIYNWAEGKQEEDREIRQRMAPHEAMLRRCFRGQERFALLSIVRRLHDCHWSLTLRASVGLLLQIPFFIAAYHLLSHLGTLNGQSFGLLTDLGKPDALISLGGVTGNLLPFVMTIANLASAFVYAHNLNHRDKFQIYSIALLFLVLLYNAPSALTLYWTLNNLYSFCRNIALKYWRRYPILLWIYKIIRIDIFFRNPIEGTPIYFKHRLAQSCLYSFSIAFLFWLYTCSTLFIHRNQNLPDRILMRTIFNHDLLYAFMVAIIIYIFMNSTLKQKLSWYPVLLIICITSFFCIPSKNIANFILWVIAFWGIQHFLEKLSYKYKYIDIFLLINRCVNFTGTHTVSDINLFPSIKDTLILDIIIAFICSIFIWYFIPFTTYLSNANEFDFDGDELFLMLLTPCIITIFLLSSFLFSSNYIKKLKYECIRLPWKPTASTGCQVNFILTSLVVIIFILWLEGAFLSYGLPQLDGERDLFDSNFRIVIDTVLLVGLFFLGLFCWRYISRKIFFFLFAFVVLMVTSLIDTSIGKDKKIDTRSYNSSYSLKIVNQNTFYSNLLFSESHNIIIFLVDSLDTFGFLKTLELYPDLNKVFDGFFIFVENLGAGRSTGFAVPQILHGEVFSGKDFPEFVKESLVGKNSIASDAVENGYKVFVDGHPYGFVLSNNLYVKDDDLFVNTSLSKDLPYLTFKFFPYFFKSIFESHVNLKNFEANSQLKLSKIDLNKSVFNKLISRIDKVDTNKILQFIYLFGTHQPYIKENFIESTREIINDFDHFFGVLRDRNLYDNSTIIIISDHGDFDPKQDHRSFYPERAGEYSTAFFPLFMIRTPDVSGNLTVRDELMSSVYLRSILRELYIHGFNNDALSRYLANLPSIRYILAPFHGRSKAIGTSNSLKITKEN